MSRLSSGGLLAYPRQRAVELTEEGEQLAARPDAAPTREALHEAWRRCPALSPAHVRVLDAAIERGDQEVSREDLAAAAGASPTSSSFANNVSRPSSLGLITYPRQGMVRGSTLLFPETLA